MQLSQEKRDQMERSIVECIVDCLENGSLKDVDLPTIVKFYGEKIDTAKSKKDLEIFLTEFIEKWPVFSPLQKKGDWKMFLGQ